MDGQTLASWGSVLATLTFIVALARDYFPYTLSAHFMQSFQRLVSHFYPYVEVRIDERAGEWLSLSDAYVAIETYLATTTSKRARKLRARNLPDEEEEARSKLEFVMDDHGAVTDTFRGVKVWWTSCRDPKHSQTISLYRTASDRRYYVLTFHKQHRELVLDEYVKHVMEEAKVIEARNRRRKLYTNKRSMEGGFDDGRWNYVRFDHPATFDTLAMKPEEKQRIKEDLDFFKNNKDYYKKIGKAWKRGYLLYGPPGTGKSTMIAAMANYMEYDVYDLELTSVKDNTELRELLIETNGKSILVIEDIDCTLDLTGDREQKEEEKNKGVLGKLRPKSSKEGSKLTLSGLLNFIDGLWSPCSSERLIVFTTNHAEKLDPALIRTGRMDMHIEMSYCSFEAFKVLANNYLSLDSHPIFDQVRELIVVDGVEVAPADVAEKLMPKNKDEKEMKTPCLLNLVKFMKEKKNEKVKNYGKKSDEKKSGGRWQWRWQNGRSAKGLDSDRPMAKLNSTK